MRAALARLGCVSGDALFPDLGGLTVLTTQITSLDHSALQLPVVASVHHNVGLVVVGYLEAGWRLEMLKGRSGYEKDILPSWTLIRPGVVHGQGFEICNSAVF